MGNRQCSRNTLDSFAEYQFNSVQQVKERQILIFHRLNLYIAIFICMEHKNSSFEAGGRGLRGNS